jgi:hypothetical protein
MEASVPRVNQAVIANDHRPARGSFADWVRSRRAKSTTATSEIAALKLDADWVILSACNTAAGGVQGAEAFRVLHARSFAQDSITSSARASNHLGSPATEVNARPRDHC